MKAIFKRELRSYFQTIIGPVFIAALLLLMGIFFVSYNISQGYPYFAAVLSSLTIILLITVPILTMRSFAEEKKAGTDQLLLTSPVSVPRIVLGKYTSMLAIFGIPMLIACLAPIVIHGYGGGAPAADYAAILAFFLMGAAYIAIGMFVSSLTENQIIAAVITFCILLVFQLVDGIATFLPSSALSSFIPFTVLAVLAALLVYMMTKSLLIADVTGILLIGINLVFFLIRKSAYEGLFASFLQSLSLTSRFDGIVQQNLDLSALIYYLTVAGIFVFLTVQSIQKRRWS